MPFKLPESMTDTIAAHNKWLQILREADDTIQDDAELQRATAKGLRLKERALPPEMLGRNYGRYCDLVNKMYDAYLNSVHLQRAPYILELITVFMKRLYELRHELVHVIVNDYIYVDSGLAELRMTPMDIQIVVPYHFPLESRKDNVEQALQKMWSDAVRRKRRRENPKPPKPPPPPPRASGIIVTIPEQVEQVEEVEEVEEEDILSIASVHTYVPEEFIQSVLIQRHERFRQWYLIDFKEKSVKRKTYFAENRVEACDEMKNKAAKIVQLVYRELMKIKRLRIKDTKRDIILGLIPDPCRSRINYRQETNKVYDRRRNTRLRIKQSYLQELEKENMRLIIWKKDDQIDDITDEIREWFKEWYYGYGFFPEYPYDIEGGTLMVVRGDYPSVEEKAAEDERLQLMMQGKTKEMLKQEKAAEKAEAKAKAEALKEAKKKEAMQLMKARCNPFADPGYRVHESALIAQLIEALQVYRASWSIYDDLPPDRFGEAVYGYMKPLITEELMSALHKECRGFVDELMRLDLKMLIEMQQLMYKRIGMKFPKIKPRKKPRVHPTPVPLAITDKLTKSLEQIFDMGLVTKPTAKITDIYGDLNYAAYEMNIQDPNATFPLPSYGDIKSRLVLSCVLGCGIQPGAVRRRSVMLIGPERNGKSFLVDTVAGELNAIKIDITPEVFSAVLEKPPKVLHQVFVTAKAFQPAVIYMRNVERVFANKVPPEDKYLEAKSIKTALVKLVKQIAHDDKIIFIATCTNPTMAKAKPMAQMFDEMILVPRTDYGTLQMFFAEKLHSIRSIPPDFPTQPLAQLIQGYGFGAIIEAFNDVMTPERIVKSNVEPLSPGEFLEALFIKGLEPLSKEEYQPYVDFVLEHGPLKTAREDYDRINYFRDDAYKKMAKSKKKPEDPNKSK